MARHAGRKISKYDGNIVLVKDLLDEYSPDAIRLYLLGSHYRAPLEFDAGKLRGAAELAARLRDAARMKLDPRKAEPGGETRGAFAKALDDDLDTPRAIDALQHVGARAEERGDYAAQRELRRLASHLGLGLA